jgi:glycosyltransferase involved in cell wall biosynthesis
LSAPKWILFAPGVHQGGGAILLKALLAVAGEFFTVAYIDRRFLEREFFSYAGKVVPVCNSILGRLTAELDLKRTASEKFSVFCFHNLPPFFKFEGKIVQFLQNRLILDPALKVNIRVRTQQKLFRLLMKRVDVFIVQTDGMKRELESVNHGASVRVCSFIPTCYVRNEEAEAVKDGFVYPASGEPHKNHRVLLEAWRLLKQEGCCVPLHLTVPKNSRLGEYIDDFTKKHQLNVVNHGAIEHHEVISIMNASAGLIFPSKIESFGLPLLEAASLGLPIVASELDFVRDVVIPSESFHPDSALSICRAVIRFLDGNKKCLVETRSPEDLFGLLSSLY